MVITMKNVQISQELFVALLHYHLSGENEYEEIIEQGLEQKLDAMLRHELYAQYKTAPTEEQREQARQETPAPSAHPRGAFLSYGNEVSYTIKKPRQSCKIS